MSEMLVVDVSKVLEVYLVLQKCLWSLQLKSLSGPRLSLFCLSPATSRIAVSVQNLSLSVRFSLKWESWKLMLA